MAGVQCPCVCNSLFQGGRIAQAEKTFCAADSFAWWGVLGGSQVGEGWHAAAEPEPRLLMTKELEWSLYALAGWNHGDVQLMGSTAERVGEAGKLRATGAVRGARGVRGLPVSARSLSAWA